MLQVVSLILHLVSGALTLDVDTPFLGAKVECLECTLLAEALCLVDELVSAIVSLAWVPFRVFVCSYGKLGLGPSCVTHTLHNTAKRIENSLRCEVLGRDEINEVLLALLLLQGDDGKLQSQTKLGSVSRTCSMILYTVGSASSRSWERTF